MPFLLRSCFFEIMLLASIGGFSQSHPGDLHFFKASHPNFQYTGRIDFTNSKQPRFWNPGVYIKARFRGSACTIVLADEVLYGKNHNFIEVVIDQDKPRRIQLKGRIDTLHFFAKKNGGIHNITIVKNTESGIGYLEFLGMTCSALLPAEAKPKRKIEFIGNSITCGMGNDLTIPCHSGEWYEQHNAYLSYGAITARALNAQYHISAVSGIGLIHSCCNHTITMPQVFDKISLQKDSIPWDFNNYQPDVVTVCLGQNDGIQDSTRFCSAYVEFLKKLRSYYPRAQLVCLTSPMAGEELNKVLRKYLSSVVVAMNRSGEKRVHSFFFSKRYYKGCDSHPDLKEHREMAGELTVYLRKLMRW